MQVLSLARRKMWMSALTACKISCAVRGQELLIRCTNIDQYQLYKDLKTTFYRRGLVSAQ